MWYEDDLDLVNPEDWLIRLTQPVVDEELDNAKGVKQMGLMINDTVDSDQLNYQTIAVGLIQDIVRERFRLADEPTPPFQVYIVWFNYTLGNWKALLSTTIEDSTYYEVTYNHRNGVAYVDSYKKFDNKTIAIPAARS